MVEKGSLYIVATPIGNLDDISKRAIEVLAEVDKIAAEDTRHSKKLLQAIGVATPMVAYHEFSSEAATNKIILELQAGAAIALISDAGTPLISDPGYKLVKQARSAGLQVIPIPGASAITAALSVAGLATDRFSFEGFLPNKTTARQARIAEVAEESRSLVFYESPHRIVASVNDFHDVLGAQRLIFVAREISKKFESHFLGTLAECLEWLQGDANQQKGEFVLVLDGCDETLLTERKLGEAIKLVALLKDDMSMKRAVAVASEFTGARKNQLYAAVLEQ